MSRNQTLVIDYKIIHQVEMSFEQFLKLCQDREGIDVAEATKRWDRIFKTYNDGKFEKDDMWAEDLSEDIAKEMEAGCENRVLELVEEFEDAEPEAPKEAPKVSQTQNKKFDKFTAEDEPEEFFAGKTFPANTEFVLPA